MGSTPVRSCTAADVRTPVTNHASVRTAVQARPMSSAWRDSGFTAMPTATTATNSSPNAVPRTPPGMAKDGTGSPAAVMRRRMARWDSRIIAQVRITAKEATPATTPNRSPLTVMRIAPRTMTTSITATESHGTPPRLTRVKARGAWPSWAIAYSRRPEA